MNSLFSYVGSIKYWKLCNMDERKTSFSHPCEVGFFKSQLILKGYFKDKGTKRTAN